MRFGILGPTQVRLADGRDVAVRGLRLRTLLALLLIDAGRVVSAQRLIDGVYGADPPANAGNALQSQVSRLRRALAAAGAPAAVVEFHPAGYRLAADPDDVDAHRFGRLAAEGGRALATDHTYAATLLREALELWRGAPLADVLDTPAIRAEAARLEELRLAAVEDHIEARLRLGPVEPLIPQVRALVAAYPLRERLHGQLMRALHGSGRRAEALAAFDDARRRFAEELGTDPSAALDAVHLAVLRSAGPPDPAGSGAPAGLTRPTLPGQLTSFIGREDELRRLGKLLEQARLVTLHGPGGAGKTRLAIEAAGRVAGEVCFVELAGLTDPADVPRAILHALNLREAGLRAPGELPDPVDRLVAALADRRLLLVLDNCEHLVGNVARLSARLLSACPAVRILATSRELLGLTGEVLCPVSGLALPPDATTAIAGREYAAVRLFADRAADVAPGFAVTPDNVDVVEHICRTLDGLPLAIELAAARLRALPLAEVAARLDDRFRLLSRGSPAAQPRHQTLRAVVEWSWDLLDDAERVLARRLTVFAGGATLAAVERVCGPLTRDAVDVLTGLVDKSLVEVVNGRYRMLDTVRAFCAGRLAEAGEADRLRRAHAAYFLDLAQTAEPHLRGADQLGWLRRLDAERDNLHAALRRAVAHDESATGLRLVTALAFYWWVRGLRSEAAHLAGELLTRLTAGPPAGLTEEYAVCVLTAAVGGSSSVPELAVGSGGSVLPDRGRPPRQPFLLYLAGMASGPPSESPEAMAAFLEDSRALAGADPWSHALVGVGLGLISLFDGRAEPARREFVVALDEFRRLGDRWGMVTTLAAMAELADQAELVALMDEALRLACELESTIDMGDLLRTRGDGYLRVGALDRAEADYVAAARLARQAGAPEIGAAARAGLAEIARERGDLESARRLCEAALAECPVGWFGAYATRFGILVALGRIAAELGDTDGARTWYQRALTDNAGVRGLPMQARAVQGLASAELARGDGERAALLLGIATVLMPSALTAGAVDLAPVIDTVRSAVGDAVYESAFRRGTALTREQALTVICD